MTLTDSLPTEDAGGLAIGDWRLIQAGLVARDAAGAPRLGIIPAHVSPLVTGTAGMAYSVAAFHAVTSRNGTGVELVANDGPASVSTTAAPGSNSRIDVIWVRCRFDLYGDTGTFTPLFGVTQGTAALTPTKPSIPSGALELATAVVTSTDVATSTTVITQTHLYTAVAGGTVRVRNSTELGAWTPADGSRAHQIDTQNTFIRAGGAWSFDGGLLPITPTSVSGTGVSIASDGSVVFTSMTPGALGISGVFSSRFRRYLVMLTYNAVADGGWFVRMNAAGTPDTGANYRTSLASTGATNGSNVTSSVGVGTNEPLSAVLGNRGQAILELDSPALATPTVGNLRHAFSTSGAVAYAANGSLIHTQSTAYDGINLFSSTATFSGHIRIYGLT